MSYNAGRREEDKREFLVAYREPAVDEYWIAMMMRYVLDSGEANDVLIHGDSTARIDVDAARLGRRLGASAFDIGTNGWIDWPGYAQLLVRYLEKHPKPKVLVFCLHPYMLSESNPKDSRYRDQLLWCYGGGGEENRPPHADAYRHYATEGLRALAGRLTTWDRAAFRSPAAPYGKRPGWLAEEWTARRGSLMLDDQIAERWPPKEMAGIEISPRVWAALKDMAAYTSHRDIFLYIRLMPVWRGTASLSDAAVRELRSIQVDYPYTAVGRPELWELDPDAFWDNYHLNSAGAAQATDRLADEIANIMKARGIKGRALGK